MASDHKTAGLMARLRTSSDANSHDALIEIQRLRAVLTEIATGRDANGHIADFPAERARDALKGMKHE